jgi:hypothetical protein
MHEWLFQFNSSCNCDGTGSMCTTVHAKSTHLKILNVRDKDWRLNQNTLFLNSILKIRNLQMSTWNNNLQKRTITELLQSNKGISTNVHLPLPYLYFCYMNNIIIFSFDSSACKKIDRKFITLVINGPTANFYYFAVINAFYSLGHKVRTAMIKLSKLTIEIQKNSLLFFPHISNTVSLLSLSTKCRDKTIKN